MTRRQRRELLKYRLAHRTVTGEDGLQHAPRRCGCPACITRLMSADPEWQERVRVARARWLEQGWSNDA